MESFCKLTTDGRMNSQVDIRARSENQPYTQLVDFTAGRAVSKTIGIISLQISPHLRLFFWQKF